MGRILSVLLLTTMLCMRGMAADTFADFQAVIANPEISPYYDVGSEEVQGVVFDIINKWQEYYKRIAINTTISNEKPCGAASSDPGVKEFMRKIGQEGYDNFSKQDLETLSKKGLYKTWMHAFCYLPVESFLGIKFFYESFERCGVNVIQHRANDIESGIKTAVNKYVIGNYETDDEKAKTVGFIAVLNYYLSQLPNANTIDDLRPIKKNIEQVARNSGIAYRGALGDSHCPIAE